MKIDVLELIEESLIGGRNGEMAYIENNPFIANLFRKYLNKNKNKNFTDFLQECIKEDKEKLKNENVVNNTYSIIEKKVPIQEYSEEYKNYKKMQNEVNEANRNLNKAKEKLAMSLDEVLCKISTYEIDYGEYSGTQMKFKINSKIITEK